MDDKVTELLGRKPTTLYEVVIRSPQGEPVVIRNSPFTKTGVPMPTLYWLVDPELTRQVSTLEAGGGVRQAERAIDPALIEKAHQQYTAERDAEISPSHSGPRPSGGVAGTRTGVKCLHAHYAYFLAGGDDPVGRWVDDCLNK